MIADLGLPLVDLLVDTRSELFELAVRSGLKVLEAMLEEDRTATCGPRHASMMTLRGKIIVAISASPNWVRRENTLRSKGSLHKF